MEDDEVGKEDDANYLWALATGSGWWPTRELLICKIVLISLLCGSLNWDMAGSRGAEKWKCLSSFRVVILIFFIVPRHFSAFPSNNPFRTKCLLTSTTKERATPVALSYIFLSSLRVVKCRYLSIGFSASGVGEWTDNDNGSPYWPTMKRSRKTKQYCLRSLRPCHGGWCWWPTRARTTMTGRQNDRTTKWVDDWMTEE